MASQRSLPNGGSATRCGIPGLYAHVSQRMRDDLTAALQARWEDSLRQRAAIDPHSPVPLLDGLLGRLLRPADHSRWETPGR
jgi:hypothetical protein